MSLCGRSQTLSRRVATSLSGCHAARASRPWPAPPVVHIASRSSATCSQSSRSPAEDGGLTFREVVQPWRSRPNTRAGVPQKSQVPSSKTTYEGIGDGGSEHLDIERLSELSNNSFGFSRATFVARERKSGIEELYMLGAVLGRGATATVYQSLNYQTYDQVAVKAIHKKYVPNRQLLLDEIRIHKVADHPNILRLLDTYEDDKMLYLVLELCKGGDLRDHIHAGDTTSMQGADDAALAMPEEDALRVFEQMVSSVHYLHRRCIVHRDLKPGNFLCVASPMQSQTEGASQESCTKNLIVKLADFGVSAYCGYEKHFLTRRIGSDGYIAPEIIRRLPYNQKADIFSLGCILHALLTGSPPECRHGTYVVDETRLKSASADTQNLLESLLQPKPEDRPSAEILHKLPLLRRSARHHESELRCEQLVKNMHAYSSFPLLKKATLVAMVSQATSDVDFVALTSKFKSICSSRSMNTRGYPQNGIAAEDLYESLLAERIVVKPGLSGCRLQQHAGCASGGPIQLAGRRASERCCQELRQDLQSLVHQIDASGAVGYSEWLASVVDSSWYMDTKRISAVFKLFDQDQDGLITESDLEGMLPDVFSKLPVNVVLKGNSSFNEEQFISLIRNQSYSACTLDRAEESSGDVLSWLM